LNRVPTTRPRGFSTATLLLSVHLCRTITGTRIAISQQCPASTGRRGRRGICCIRHRLTVLVHSIHVLCSRMHVVPSTVVTTSTSRVRWDEVLWRVVCVPRVPSRLVVIRHAVRGIVVTVAIRLRIAHHSRFNLNTSTIPAARSRQRTRWGRPAYVGRCGCLSSIGLRR